MVKCSYCQKTIPDNRWNKKYCCYEHGSKARNLVNMKELMKLTLEEKKIRLRLLHELHNSGAKEQIKAS